jgi:hypothetical protein
MDVAVTRTFDVTQLQEMRAWARYFNIAKLAAFVAVLCSPFALWGLFWTSPRDYPFLSSMFYVPLVICGCAMLLSRVWRGDRFVKLLLGTGIAVRVVAAGAYVWLGFVVFNVTVDAFHYWNEGMVRASEFSGIGWAAFRPPWSSTNLICNICGIITLVVGNAMPTLFVIFALAGLWGAYFFYRAFCIAFPNGDRGLYGLLIVLLPSIVYWSSAISKDALEQLFIGMAAYGFARVVREMNAKAVIICAVGIAGATAARPHVGAMLAVGMLLPFTMGKTRGGWVTVSAKVLMIPILAAATYFTLRQASDFVGVEGSDFKSSVTRLKGQGQNTETGGSAYNEGESLSRRVIQGPFLPFRPFPWEVHSAMAAVAALEGLGLLFFAWSRRRDLWALLHQWRDPYVLFILVYSLEFAVIFAAATSNFGILVRQRIMMVPVFLMLLCVKKPLSNAAARVPPAHRSYGFQSSLPAAQLGRSIS